MDSRTADPELASPHTKYNRDLHRTRSNSAPRKRTRFAPARPNPNSSNLSTPISSSPSSLPPTPRRNIISSIAANGSASAPSIIPRLRSTPNPPLPAPTHSVSNASPNTSTNNITHTKLTPSPSNARNNNPINIPSRSSDLSSSPARYHPVISSIATGSLSQRISAAEKHAEANRTDPRFIPGVRPLHSMRDIKSSLAFSLFTNGYVRHDELLAHDLGVNYVGSNDILLSRPRMPYNASSRHVLTALDLGLLPVDHELPPTANLTYYDGCLVAEVFDFRGITDESLAKRGHTWRKSARFSRILLRPDTCSHIADCDLLTASFSDREALKFESRLLLAENPILDLDPKPKQFSSPSTGMQSLSQLVIRKPPITKKRRRERIGDVYPRPPVSMSALMLIDAAAKEQMRINLKTIAQKQKPPSISHASAALPEHLRGCGEQTAVSAKKILAEYGNSFKENRAPLELFTKLLKQMPLKVTAATADGNSSSRNINHSSNNGRPTKQHERLRTIRMLLPDRTSAQYIRQARNSHAAGGMQSAEQIEILRKTQGMLHNLNRAGRPVCVLELVSRPGKGCDVALFRGIIGDKARDVNKIGLSTAEEANAFLNQFKKILERENYICIHDGDPQKVAQSQIQQQAIAQANNNTNNMNNGNSNNNNNNANLVAQRLRAAAAAMAGQAVQNNNGGNNNNNGLAVANMQVAGALNANLYAARAQQVAQAQHQHQAALRRVQLHREAAMQQVAQAHMQQVARGGRLSPAAAAIANNNRAAQNPTMNNNNSNNSATNGIMMAPHDNNNSNNNTATMMNRVPQANHARLMQQQRARQLQQQQQQVQSNNNNNAVMKNNGSNGGGIPRTNSNNSGGAVALANRGRNANMNKNQNNNNTQQIVNNAIPPNLLKNNNNSSNSSAANNNNNIIVANGGIANNGNINKTQPRNVVVIPNNNNNSNSNNDTNSRGSASRGTKKR